MMRTLQFAALGCLLAGSAFAFDGDGFGQPVKVHSGFKFTEGPAHDREGNIYFTDIPNKRIHKIDLAGQLSTALEDSNGANGLMLNAAGEIVACETDTGRVVAIDPATKNRRIIAEKYNGKRFNAPNDLVIDKAGGIWFTDPLFGNRTKHQDAFGVYYVAPDGTVTRAIADLPLPNGVILSPDEKTLYVVPTGKADMMAYPVEGPGKLGAGRVFCTLKQPDGKQNTGGDGLTVDSDGRLYITSQLGIQVFDKAGKPVAILRFPEPPSNCTFGGKDRTTLFVTARTSVYSMTTKQTGHKFANPH